MRTPHEVKEFLRSQAGKDPSTTLDRLHAALDRAIAEEEAAPVGETRDGLTAEGDPAEGETDGSPVNEGDEAPVGRGPAVEGADG